MRRQFRLWWELCANRWGYGFIIFYSALVVAFWVSGVGERWHKARLGRYGASAPLLLTHHLEARACRLGEHGTDMRVRLYLTNRSTLPIDNLRFVAHLDGQLPLEKPAMVETLRPAVVSKAHTFPIDTVRIELRFPPVSEERLRVQVEYTARSMSPTKHSAVGEVILKPCRED